MKLNSIRRAAALGLTCLALASSPAAHAEDKMTLQSLIDRQMILDQITRYYYNFGKVDRQNEESFYSEDGELILGTRHYKGREGIKSAYNRPPAAPAAAAAGAAPAPAAAAAPAPRERLAFNVEIGNPLIIVRGDTATGGAYWQDVCLVYGSPGVLIAGRYEDTLRKVNGQWRIAKRSIVIEVAPPGTAP